jgi:isopentenyldiphosphate isomerase
MFSKNSNCSKRGIFMETELIKIYDKDRNSLGVVTRSEVHKFGHWHETFHCWFVSRENGNEYVLFQMRSNDKKDFPNLLDITAAGHILADESVQEGIREVKEELGIEISFGELKFLGIINDCIRQENFIDNELCNVFIFESNIGFDEFRLQKEEVSGMLKAEFKDFQQLWAGEKDEISVTGFRNDSSGNALIVNGNVSIKDFVPHDPAYIKAVVKGIREYFNQ